jgi:hypothetical protein
VLTISFVVSSSYIFSNSHTLSSIARGVDERDMVYDRVHAPSDQIPGGFEQPLRFSLPGSAPVHQLPFNYNEGGCSGQRKMVTGTRNRLFSTLNFFRTKATGSKV